VRFEKEVTKTDALGIFDRGDHAIIGTYPGKKLTHNYTANLVDVCPVGAFTSKDFRFKQRVWFLQDKPAVCPGCSTGCSVDVYGKEETGTYYRMKPREGEPNGHWMCDTGRGMYRHLNQEVRQRFAVIQDQGRRKDVSVGDALVVLAKKLKGVKSDDVALLVSAQYTNEEYDALLSFFVGQMGVKKVFQWREPTEKIEDFDGLLLRGDRNANTAGLLASLKKYGITQGSPKNQFEDLAKSGSKVVVALVPEIPSSFPSLKAHLMSLAELDFVSFWTVNGEVDGIKSAKHIVPIRGFAEKRGTFINAKGNEGHLTTPFQCPVEGSLCVKDTTTKLSEAYAKH
jgi:NADH-quinone oxidoreductase subunit G